jgi:hypothetical protein
MPNGVEGAELLLRWVEARVLGFLGTLAPAPLEVDVAEVSTDEAATKASASVSENTTCIQAN